MDLRLATHTETGKPMVEVWRDGEFIASIYAHEDGLQIVSKYLDDVEPDFAFPPGVVIRFSKEAEALDRLREEMAQREKGERGLDMGPRMIVVGGEVLGTTDNFSIHVAEATQEELEKLESAYEIRLVKMLGESGSGS